MGFNFLGNDNNVSAGPGPLALAGSVFKDGQTVTKEDFGVAINNFRIGGALANSQRSETASASRVSVEKPAKKAAADKPAKKSRTEKRESRRARTSAADN